MIGRTAIKYQFVALLICIGGQVNAAAQCENVQDIANDEGKQALKEYMQEQNDKIIVSISTTVIEGQSNSKSMPDTTTTTDIVPTTSTMTGNDDTTLSKSKTTLTQERSTTATNEEQATTKACQSSQFKFPTKNHTDYVQYNGSVPQLKPFTACVWLRPEEIGAVDSYGVMSYCTKGSRHCETLLVSLSAIRMTVLIEKESGQTNFGYTINVSQWTYACIVMSQSVAKYYINGSFNSESDRTLNEHISNGGVLILGNAQGNQINGKSPGEPEDGSHGFYGEMKEFQLWTRELTGNEIKDLFKSGGCSRNTDSLVNFNVSNSVIKGNVLALWTTPCP